MADQTSSSVYEAEFARLAAELEQGGYPAWLIINTGGWLMNAASNAVAFSYAIKNMPRDTAVLEIGTYLGQSACMITYLMWRHGRFAPMFCCDPYHFEQTEKPIGGFFDASTKEFRQYCIETAKRNLAMFSGHHVPHLVEAYSHEFLAAWARGQQCGDLFGRPVRLGGPLGFVYIDGSHTYEAAKGDFLGADPFVVPGGFVFFDDSTPGWAGVHRVVQEVLQRPDYELLFARPNYFFRKRSRPDFTARSEIAG